ncbi:hypothetical protein LXA43DRAFT_633294 [Ganoderma leucocontextum]|nr:hypothetical protein LXA43DRAFT_633294 [Ganoderma leucocontextum]
MSPRIFSDGCRSSLIAVADSFLPFLSLFFFYPRGVFTAIGTQCHTSRLTHHHYPQCIARCQPSVDGKPTRWQSTFAARRTQAPALAANHFTVAAKWRTSQRLSGTVACRGQVTRIVRSGRVALQG